MAKFEISSDELIYLDSENIEKVIASVLGKVGVPTEDAQQIAAIICTADLRGVDTHGIRTLPIYVKRYLGGGLNPAPDIKVVTESASSAVVDGDNGLGHIVGYRAMKLAMKKAKETGVGIVFANHSNHFGAGAYYSMMAQSAGMIGLSMANAQARMAPTGGVTPCYGTNPWSVAFPCAQGDIPVTLDMANCVVANSNILMARELGMKIPTSWGMTVEGEPTDDPNLAVLPAPFGGYKGYGIAVAVELLAGILSGAAYGAAVGSYSSENSGQNVGQVFAAIDLKQIMPPDMYAQRYHDFTSSIKGSRLAKGCEKVYLPGEKEYDNFKNRSIHGIPIDRKYVLEINRLCEELGVSERLTEKK